MRINDGFATLIAFANIPTAKFYEKVVTPPPVSIGKAIDTTTMRNTAYRTANPAKLKSVGNMKVQVAYDPNCLTLTMAQIGVNQTMTLTFPDSSSLVVWGYIDSFTPGALEESKQPLADLEFIATNLNNSNPQVETAPAFTASAS